MPGIAHAGMPMSRLAYTLLLYLVLPLLLARAWWRGRRSPVGGENLGERLGLVAPATDAPVVLHCVSVGETMAAVPLIDALLARGVPLWITSTTLTGAAQVRKLYAGRVRHSFLPADTPDAVARFLDRASPRALLVMETEIWPNLVRAASTRNVPVALVNARLSEKSARGYARFASLTRATLARFTLIAAQDEATASRFRALGAPRVEITGNLKFDLAPGADVGTRAAALRASWRGRPAWVAASTHAGEDEVVLAAHRRLRERFPGLLLILVPRHPERFDAVAALVVREGFALARRSRDEAVGDDVAVYLGDTMGELGLLYACADVAFVGGSYSGTGGHNLLEPAGLGLPVLSGPSLFNFRQVADELLACDALRVVEAPGALADAVAEFLADEQLRADTGDRGSNFVLGSRGACARTVVLLEPLLAR